MSTPYDPTAFTELRVFADSYDQLQRNRIAISNRLFAGAVPKEIVAEIMESVEHSEKLAAKAMKKSFCKAAPEVVAWLKTDATVGVGEHLVARLLGAIGHPVIATPYHWEGEGKTRKLISDPPFVRNVSKLWSYAGIGDPSRKRRTGMSAAEAAALGNPRAKMLVYLIALGTVKCVGTSKAEADTHVSNDDSDTLISANGQLSGEVHTPTALAESFSPNGHTGTDIQLVYAKGEILGSDNAIQSANESSIEASQSERLSGSETVRASINQTTTVSLPNAETDPDYPKTKTHTALVRRRSPYRDIYDLARIHYADREGWTPMHQHNASLRRVAKEFLKDLYVVMHEPLVDQGVLEEELVVT